MGKKTDYKEDYKKEYMDTLNRIYQDNVEWKDFKYFLDLSYVWMAREFRQQKQPEVVLLGPGMPEEIIWAAGVIPYWILGGSYGAGNWADDMLPRDTDPINRSVTGFLYETEGVDYSRAVFLVPVNCDSMRKIAYFLKQDGRSVITLDIPPDKHAPGSLEKLKRQIHLVTEQIEKHLRTRITAVKLQEANQKVVRAREALQHFLALTADDENLFSGPARMLIQNSYYYSENLEEWTGKLRHMNEEIMKRRLEGGNMGRARSSQPGILLLGSPIYFPNYKIPFLIQDIGLSIVANVDIASLKLERGTIVRKRVRSRDRLLDQIAEQWYRKDGSAFYIQNQSLLQNVTEQTRKRRIEGVVYHILKGQIEYDFELPVYEKLFETLGIPLFRLETDYQYQDVEQLRIRMEAFAEMLEHRQQQKERVR